MVTNQILEPDILIVGSGISGAALACAIRGRGYDVVLAERSNEPPDTARGDHLQPYSVSLLESWGVLEDFLAAGAEQRLGTTYLSEEQEVILSVPLDRLEIPHPYYLYLDHDVIGNVLLKKAGDDQNFTLLRPATARGFNFDNEHMTSVSVSLPDGTVAEVRAHLVVGADGRDSRVRGAVGIPARTYKYPRPLVAMFGPHPLRDPRNEVFSFLGNDKITTCIPRIGGIAKIGFTLDPSEILFWRNSSAEQRMEAIALRVPGLAGYESEIAGFYPVIQVSTKAYTRGNVVLLGDAVHAMHPARGQGMNVALRGVERLIDCLPSPRMIADRVQLHAALQRYDAIQKRANTRLLEVNHARAKEDVGALRKYLRKVAVDPRLTARYIRETTGYPPEPERH